ncbi:MAG: hypothetical protein L6R42_010355, partial [Xanthoria sp. 1 TBL-2021]
QLEDAAKVLQSERNEAVQELGSVKCDHDALAQRAEDYQIRAENSEKAHADSQSEVERMVAENSRLATVHRETKLRHEQEKAEMTEQLAKANKELHGLKSLPKSTKPPKSAAQKQLENENAKLKSDLKQGEQEKEALRKANEDSSSRFESLEEKWKQSQEEAEAARVTINRLEDEANERETARDAQETKSRAELDLLVSEKSTAEMELKTAKEEKCALAKKVTELSTPSPPSSQNAQASFNTSSYQSPQKQTIHNYEARVAGLNETLARASHRISMLESRLRATGSHPPSPMNMSSANHLRPGAPFHQPMPVSGPLGMPSFLSGGGVHGYNTGSHSHYNGAPMGPMIAPAGSLGYTSFPPSGQAQGMNPGFVPHPQAYNGPVFPSNGHQGPLFNPGPFPPPHHHGGPLPSRSGTNNYEYPPLNPGALPSPQNNDKPTASPKPQEGRQGAPLDPGAASFTPGGGN